MQEQDSLMARTAQVEQKFIDTLEQMRIKNPHRFREITEVVIARMKASEASGKGNS